MAKCTCRKVTGGCCYEFYLEQTEHGVAYVEAMPPVVVGDITVTLPHCVHPPCQRLTVVEKTQKENDVYHMCQTQGLWAKCGPTSHIAWPAGAYKVYAFSARILTIIYNNNAFHDDER